ncbi:PepSY-like domain-containing protein [Limnoglobus roseus]|uniref:Putative beta-lactamase-inhibitor-like PepSY-like domain-containing protein n=1 Tax=Limnoglobus roseus TaxID=2598579 RepID=A0A5C1A9Y0_9BACT|nr:PepSY-like domain-containing protein [Limnoglobus roseus]QEL15027.1 hypothetical protein PX52LOC_01932 [Limnoglobus roseus]
MTRRVLIVGGVGAVFGLVGTSLFWKSAAEPQPMADDKPEPAADGGDEIPVDKLPQAIAAAVREHFPKAKFDSVSTYTEAKVLHYEVFFKHNNADYEVTVTEKGKVIEIAHGIEFKDLPKAVAAAVTKRFPKGKIGEVAELTEPGVPGKHYHVELTTAAGKEHELTYTSDGKLVHEESD